MAKVKLSLSKSLERAYDAYRAGNLPEAERICRTVLAVKHDAFDALQLLTIVQGSAGQYDKALASCDGALRANPNHAGMHYNRGLILQGLRRFEEALASYDRALQIQPDYADALNNRGNALQELMRYAEALENYQQALMLRPDYAEAHSNRGNALKALNRFEEALASYDRALALRPDYADAHKNRGSALFESKRYAEALAAYDRALALNPETEFLPGRRFHAKMFACDWRDFDRESAQIISGVRAGRPVSEPFSFFAFAAMPEDQSRCAQIYAAKDVPPPGLRLWRGERYAHDRIRLAYVSADFRTHATAILMAELFELHDRSRFEVTAYSLGPDDKSDMRGRVVKAFDRFHDVGAKSNIDIAKLLNGHEVDIAVDLKGYTAESRPKIFAFRPAPVQVSYLGYPGTVGADFIDYVVGDPIVTPFEQQPYYSEKIVQLPDCYQVNDRKRAIAEPPPSRAAAGLPEEGLVFCCFNNSWKMTPAIFDIWMRLLAAVEGSVLWLLRDNEAAETNLRREATARGIDAGRLVFAGRMALADHLARHRLADLFLDTLPYNAHTTASDALWAGLPVLTCRGETFAGRVAASLLNAAGLQELVTANLADYEALALKLAREPAALAAIKAKLARNRDSCPLFDTVRFTRNIEAAYITMWEIAQRGEPPRSFRVDPLPS